MQVRNSNRSSTRGLTLIEILGVLTIIGVLAAVLIPSISFVSEKAQKTKAASHLRQLVLAYTICLQSGDTKGLNACKDIHSLAAYLAKQANLNDPQLWLLDQDPLLDEKAKELKTIIKPDGSPTDDFKGLPLSFSFVVKLPSGLCPSTAPIAWSRGLKEDGTWDETEGVWSSTGGYIAFLDGHVEWYDNLKDTGKQFCHHQNYNNTSNYKEALGPNIVVLSGK